MTEIQPITTHRVYTEEMRVYQVTETTSLANILAYAQEKKLKRVNILMPHLDFSEYSLMVENFDNSTYKFYFPTNMGIGSFSEMYRAFYHENPMLVGREVRTFNKYEDFHHYIFDKN